MSRIIFLVFLLPIALFAQPNRQPNAGEIKLKLKKLNFLGSVLYVAAHPDDENTRIITAMANGRLATTGYLSMTRGDGGQNLIGPEIRDQLGLIRTQELLAARRIDGGEQFFTRANDFGYSKSADETFSVWGKDHIMHDVVKVFRQFQPDVVITRFPPDERAGHGHHTASAILAQEAFDAAAQRNVYPHQVGQLGIWQAKRLYTNTGRWWNNTINENTPGVLAVDVGGYNPLLGQSYSEIAAVSRSQHKSQGFGSKGTRGKQLEFLEYVKGERATQDLFEGINTTWTRLTGGDKILPLVSKIIEQYSEDKPQESVASLLHLRRQIMLLEQSVWRERKLAEVEELIFDCTGFFIEFTADQYWVAPGEPVKVSVEVVNRSSKQIVLEKLIAQGVALDTTVSVVAKDHVPILFSMQKIVQRDRRYTAPYWLSYPHTLGMFHVPDSALIGTPENPPAISVTVQVTIEGERISLNKPLSYKWTDPVKGEMSRPFEIVPPIFLNLYEDVLVFKDDSPKLVRVLLKSGSQQSQSGQLRLSLPKGWKAEPAFIDFTLKKTGEEQIKSFRVFPSAEEMTGTLSVEAVIDDQMHQHSVKVISYDHIPIQTLLPLAEAKLARVNLKNDGLQIGYLKGAGDDLPAALRNIGYSVMDLKNEDIILESIQRFDAIVLGVRAVNTNERMGFIMPVLLEYVKLGGTLVVQYNTNFDLETDAFAPYPLSISRDRVTEEDSEVRFIKPNHRVLNYPNKITAKDFDGWVQERGLYFPNKWDAAYEAILSMNDKGETAKDGSLLIAQYGNGHYVYTGLSFFRELPEGVPGAYKLFANMLSLSKPVVSVQHPEKTEKQRHGSRRK